MLITNPYVRLEMIVENAQFNFSSPCNQPFADISLLNDIDKEIDDFMTLELNKSVLNSELDTIDNIHNIAFLSNSLSDSNCQFGNVYILSLQQLNEGKDFFALSLDFGVNYPKKIRVVYRSNDSSNNCETIVDDIDNSYIVVDMQGKSIIRVDIYFLESWAPFQFAYLQEVDFGIVYKWRQDDIIDLTITEETPFYCTTLPVDTVQLTVYLPNDQFNMINNKNLLDYLNNNQKFKIIEKIEDTETGEIKTIDFGTYYLSNIKNESEHKVTFNLSTILSKLDKKEFIVSNMYDYSKAYDVILAICREAGVSDYIEIDESLKNKYLVGYIPKMSCRAALQQVLFVTNSILYDNRSDKIRILKSDYSVKQIVDYDKIFYPYEIEQDNSIAKISYEYFSYFRNFFGKEKLATISVNSVKPFTINFSKPIDPDTLEVDDSSIIISKYALYATIMPLTNIKHDVTLRAITYLETKYNGETSFGNSENIKEYNINNIKFLNHNNSEDIMNSISKFNSKVITYKIEYLCTGQETGKYTKFIFSTPLDFITSDKKQFLTSDGKEFRAYPKQIIGYLKYQTIDLAHGMIAKAEIVLRK